MQRVGGLHERFYLFGTPPAQFRLVAVALRREPGEIGDAAVNNLRAGSDGTKAALQCVEHPFGERVGLRGVDAPVPMRQEALGDTLLNGRIAHRLLHHAA